MRGLLVCALLVAAIAAALANDGWSMGDGGRVRLVTGQEHPSIRMVREWIRLDAYRTRYTVAATFEFHNDGPATTVTMGFPEGGGGADFNERRYVNRTAFTSFRTWVDGQPVTARRRRAEVTEEGSSYDTLWTKTVSFARDQTRIVRVVYTSPVGDISTGEHTAAYRFTGGNWKGAVGSTDLLMTVHDPGTNIVYTNPAPMGHRGNTFSYHWENWQAEDTFYTGVASTLPGALIVGTFGDAVVTNPGQPVKIDWPAPAGLLRQGTAFIRLSDLASSMQGPGADPSLSWDARTRAATLASDRGTARFVVGQPTMWTTHGTRQATIALPAAPFLLDDSMYVPLRPIVEDLGGVVTADMDTRRIWYRFS